MGILPPGLKSVPAMASDKMREGRYNQDLQHGLQVDHKGESMVSGPWIDGGGLLSLVCLGAGKDGQGRATLTAMASLM